jgi:hypothetical protein
MPNPNQEFAVIILTDDDDETAGFLYVDVTGEKPTIVRQALVPGVAPTHAFVIDDSEAERPFSTAHGYGPAQAIEVHLSRLYATYA